MIHAFSFTCARDMDLSELMSKTFQSHCPDSSITIFDTDTQENCRGYGNGAGWPQAMMKLRELARIAHTFNVRDDEYILSVDSDVVFTSPEVFKHVKQYGIIGIKHRPDFSTKVGKWSHMSGALIFLRGDIATKMAELPDDTLNMIRFHHFKPFNLTENEDVVLSYLANYVGADLFDLGTVPGLSSGDFENEVLSVVPGLDKWHKAPPLKSFYHLNYCPTQFLGEPVTGKWDIPRILKQKGIEL